MTRCNQLSSVLCVSLVLFGMGCGGNTQGQPQPQPHGPSIASISPSHLVQPFAGGPQAQPVTLTVNGNSFTDSSVINWEGKPQITTFVNQTQLTAVIAAADWSNCACLFHITVTNPPNLVSNTVTLQVFPNP